MELYRRSLDFEDLPDTRVDLAIADLYANHPDDALAESGKALAAVPDNTRALGVRARALMKKGDYEKAAEAFERVVRLNPDLDNFYSLGICLLQIKDTSTKEKTNSTQPPCSSR